ncbi:hypothetical protein [Candidatus Enterococcus ferrettii]|uniref:Transposase n=1 Tax=Candidatus Enterococcus ferrettii TaxID=2815324 RepID=A0ABV0ENA0_9ENTE|nr:hypothetical protein [Enterococcus sp. 665A]MBO1342323.1 hypothetical protein [Enterococcus sp. 665A]
MIVDMNKTKMINDAVMSTAVRKAEERGIEEGADMRAVEIALNLLKMGLSVEQVAASTGLTIKETEEIRDNLL